MCAEKKEKTPGLVTSILKNKCTRCRKGNIYVTGNAYDFKNMMKMPEHCDVCGQPFEPEVGFYYGTGYVSYALSLMICMVSFIAWVLIIGMSLEDNRILGWIIANAVLLLALQPLLMRISRTIWLAIFVHYNPRWKTEPPLAAERTNADMKNNW